MRRLLLVAIGIVLLVAAVAKIAALSGPVDTLGWPRELIVAGAAVELLLGGWLLSGAAIRVAHLATIAVFVLFAGLSTYQVIRGVPSCGCLGKLYVHPAWMLSFDLLTLAALVAVWFLAAKGERSDRNGPSTSGPAGGLTWRTATVGVAIAAVSLLVVAFGGIAFAGSLGGALGVASGREVVISPEIVDLGRGAVGETKRATVQIINASAKPVRIVGGKNSCGCMVTGELPVTVPAHGSVAFPIEVSIRGEGYREVVFTLFTDQANLRTLSGRVRLEGEAVAMAATE